ncbi:hypothetical protein PQX77_005590 [Marasmius sp. AFHP31]|nr:hypothetical protein PQX77_005590 [Marasmius sp. AFHP31]
MSTFLPNSRNFSINGGQFIHVGRDQHNHYNNASASSADGQMVITQGTSSTTMTVHVGGDQINHIVQQEVKEHTVFDDAFEEDFRRCTGVLNSQVAQVYAIDIGTVPSLLLRNELVPYAHFADDLDLLGLWFISGLSGKWCCHTTELWIDSARGIICHGPAGPHSEIRGWEVGKRAQDVPSTTDLLQEDVFLRFLASKKSKELEESFISRISLYRTVRNLVPGLVNLNVVQVFSNVNNAPIAIAHQTWDDCSNPPLLDQTLLENGLMRFRLSEGEQLELGTGIKTGKSETRAWLSQAWSIFYALGITLDDNLGDFQLTQLADASLEGSLSRSRAKRQRRLEQPIYLFVHPLPSNLPFNDEGEFKCRTRSLHYWSFREDGESPLSPKTCRYFGLPTTLYLFCYIESTSWTDDCYRIVHRYQLLRGFDPTTTDFARHIGHGDIVFQPVNDSIRLKELHEEQVAGLTELRINSNSEDVYNSDDYSLAADFYTDPEDGIYTNSAHTSGIQERKDPHEDPLASSDIRIQDLAVSTTKKLTMKTNHGAGKRQTAGAGFEGEFEGIERSEQHMDQVLECTTLSTLIAERPCLPSTSVMNPSSDDTSLGIMLPTPSFPAQPTRWLATSHSETYKDGGAHPTSTHIDPSTYPVGSDTTISINDTPQNARRSTNNHGHYDDLASNTGSAASYPPASAIQAFAYSANMVDPTNRDGSLTHHRNGGPPASAFQQRWVPRSFVPNVSCIIRPASGLVPTTPSSGSQSRSPIGNAGDRDGNEDLD